MSPLFFADCPHRGFYRIFGRQQPSGHQPLAHSSVHDFEHLCRGYFRRNACQETSGHIQQAAFKRQQPDAHARIYVLAGSFAASAKAMGAVDATVNLALSILPASMILPGLFLAACFISVSIGTSVGTVVALVPIAAGLAHSMDANVGMMTAIIVGGAYFGDNLSFISDTTVVATQTQNCKMSDKFKVNSMIVVPAAVLVLIAYSVMGVGLQAPTHINEVEYMKVLPYLIVLITAIAGMNVMAVLTRKTLLCGMPSA